MGGDGRIGEPDSLRIAQVARLEEPLHGHLARIEWSAERVNRERGRALRQLVAAAQGGSPWHAERLSGVDAASLTEGDLAALPVMTKADLMANFDSIVTDARLGREQCEAHLASGGYLLDEYHVIASGGSSGQRGLFVYGWDAWATCYASIARFQLREWRADPALAGVPRVTATVAAAQPSHLSAAIRRTFSSPTQPQALFPVTRPLDQIVAGLNALRPTVLMGYASFLPRLALEAQAGRLRIAPRRIITISEPLLPELRALLERTWQVPVANAYGMSEGLFSGFCGHASHLPDDLCIVEAVDAAGRPVPTGVSAARILVTNLYNRALPLIRYEVTDELMISAEPCDCGCAFRRIDDPQGRAEDLFTYPQGSVIHPHLFRSVLGAETAVVEYQVRQTVRGAHIEVVPAHGIDVASLAARLETALSAGGLHPAVVTVAPVRKIDRGPAGKLRRFVPIQSSSR
jgi:phenylacetate-coenzyme A ligase PaaK-like adenylate-forming protein